MRRPPAIDTYISWYLVTYCLVEQLRDRSGGFIHILSIKTITSGMLTEKYSSSSKSSGTFRLDLSEKTNLIFTENTGILCFYFLLHAMWGEAIVPTDF